MTTIVEVIAREVLDSRGTPTVEAEVHLDCGAVGRATVPSGASTGERESLERRDAEDESRYGGKGVLGAVDSVNEEIADALVGEDALEQRWIDKTLRQMAGDNMQVLGANAVLSVSLATANAAAAALEVPLYRYLGGTNAHVLPVPMFNILNGGKHAADSADVQEFMVMPVGAETYREALRWGVEIYWALGDILKSEGLSRNVGDEGGYAPRLPSNAAVLDRIVRAIEAAGHKPGDDVVIALDAAASTLWEWGGKTRYRMRSESLDLDVDGLIGYWAKLADDYPIASLEDGLEENDWGGWKKLTARLGDKRQIVGDDLFVTKVEFLRQGIARGSANSLLVKLNQVGTVSDTLDAVRMAQCAGWTTVVSHRSGETEDTSLADLAVAVNAGQVKTGAPARSERVAKYNRLLRIEEELDEAAEYAGRSALPRWRWH